jgi:hypothetical protein
MPYRPVSIPSDSGLPEHDEVQAAEAEARAAGLLAPEWVH